MIEIKHRYTGEVLYTYEGANLAGADLAAANLTGADLVGADLVDADLAAANLTGADLAAANLTGADLRGANLAGANLTGATLTGATLKDADLTGADLRRAHLAAANLTGADLGGANLAGANLRGANLTGANLTGANLLHFSICPPEGAFVGWKKVAGGVVLKIQIPADAERASSLVGRKCRASHVVPLAAYVCQNGELVLTTDHTQFSGARHDDFIYTIGRQCNADEFDGDIRVECTHGIHFFMTASEAM